LHSCNYVYRDVKPDNFLLGKEERDKIFLIDFGLSKRFRDPNTGLHIPYRDGKNLTGTARYASINTHLGMEQSRRDDIEALSYLLIFFLKGSLPWQNMPGRNFKEKSKRIGSKKMETKISDLCAGCPKEMEKFVQHARNLKYDERPNYEFLGKLLSSIRERELKENKDDCILDWEMQLQINGK
jgi:serine/threonine protein kinase